MKTILKIESLYKQFGEVHVLNGIDCEIREGEIVSVIGPSGCGKSTFIRCLNGLERPTSGRVLVDGVDIFSPEADLPAIRSKVGMVFQEINIFGHLSVLENVMLGLLKIRKCPGRKRTPKRCACCGWSVWARNWMRCRMRFPAGRSSVWASPAAWRCSRR